MKLGVYLRNMGPASSPDTITKCALAAERACLDSLWLADHIAIPPDDAEGSGGRYLEPLATLAYLAGLTERIRLGSGVLVLPYRPPLITAKWVATVQELSRGRLLLGVGLGWMEAEFRAVGARRGDRGRVSDDTLAFLNRCFADDHAVSNGQPFLFRPRPARPPIIVGGSPPHALERAARYGDGWMPMARAPGQLEPAIAELGEMFARAGKPAPEIVVLTSLPLDDRVAATDLARRFAAAGATTLVHSFRYQETSEFEAVAERLGGLAAAGLG